MGSKNYPPEKEMAEHLHIKVSPDLKRAIGAEADRRGLTMNELIARLLADNLGKPGLGFVPRKRMGRPRKELQAAR